MKHPDSRPEPGTEPMPLDVKQHYQDEAVARRYDRERFGGPVGRVFDLLEKRALRAMLRGILREVPGPKTLDIPCGTGRITEVLLELGLEVTGGDISPAMIDVARRRCVRFGIRATFRPLDLDGLDLTDGWADLVTCIRLFHHLDTTERTAILRELARVSRKYVLVNISFSSPFYRLRRRVKRSLGQGVSRTSSTWEEIRREAAAAGLSISRTRFVMERISEDMLILFEKDVGGALRV